MNKKCPDGLIAEGSGARGRKFDASKLSNAAASILRLGTPFVKSDARCAASVAAFPGLAAARACAFAAHAAFT